MIRSLSLPAQRYAKALFQNYQTDEKVSTSISDAMTVLLQGFNEEKLLNYIESPSTSSLDKVATLKSLFFKSLNKELILFLNFLALKKRIHLLPEISEAYLILLEEKAGVKRVVLEVAYEPSKAFIREITDALKRKTNKEIKLSFKVDTNLIGGFKYEMDGWIYDCSLQGKVNSLKKTLIV